MNVDFDPAAVISFLRGIVGELREKRLWPVAVALLVAIIAVPVLLSKSSAATPLAQVAQPASPPSASTSLPALSVQSTPAQSRLTGTARDPFPHGATAGTTAGSTAASATSAAGTAASAASTAARAASGGTTVAATSGTSTTTTTPATITPNAKPTPTTAALSATQSYHVTLAITNSAGGLNTIDPLERLSVLPSEKQPMLVELGVLHGGHRVLFAVQPGTVVNGPGVCTPGPIDCEVLSLGQDQTEGMARQTSAGLSQGPLFALSGITADQHPSVAAADQARRQADPVGRELIDTSPLTAWTFFEYQPSVGALVDLRNLTVGG
jgi:hypothetical protein